MIEGQISYEAARFMFLFFGISSSVFMAVFAMYVINEVHGDKE